MAVHLRQVGRASLVGAAVLASTLATSTAHAASTTNPIASVKTDSALAAKVISSIRKGGTLVVAADASYAPNEFIEGGKVVGMDADLAAGIGKVLNLKVSLVNETFDGIIPGLAAKKYNLGISSFTDTKAREKTVDFVDYFSAGTSFFVLTKGGPAIESLANLCGHTVAVESGTTEQQDATTQSKTCTSAGHAKVTVDPYPTQSEANLALKSGRDQVSMADSPVAAYQVKQSGGTFKLSGKAYGTAPYGIAIPKNNGMAPVILGAIKDLIADGSYTKILNKWGVESGAITKPGINGATS
jgi:polar amino acid transport system substrate-binding protein